MCTAVYLGNRSPTKALALGLTLYEARFNTKPSLSHLKRLGCDSYVQIHPDLYSKWRTKLLHCTLLGYVENTTKQYKVWHREGRRLLVIASQDVDFDEDSFGNRIPQSNTTPNQDTSEKQHPVLDFLQALANPDDKLDLQRFDVSFTNQQASTTVKPLSQVET